MMSRGSSGPLLLHRQLFGCYDVILRNERNAAPVAPRNLRRQRLNQALAPGTEFDAESDFSGQSLLVRQS